MEIAGYRIMERIGGGGMGEVYKAYHPGLDRTAAVKILYQKEMKARFENEAAIQASIRHPNIARVYEYSSQSERPCIIMEYIEGLTLDSYLHHRGKLSPAKVREILLQIVSALQYLHDKGIIHRDIKPQNFKVDPSGVVKMLDFGIARQQNTPRLTQQGFIVGTMEYMAPEQFRQQSDKRSDIWSLGVLCYEMVTGYLPFEAEDPVVLRMKIQKGTYMPPQLLAPDISPELRLLISQSLQVQPEARIGTKELQALLTKGKGEAPVLLKRKKITRLPDRKIVYSFLLAVPLFIALLFLFFENESVADETAPKKDSLSQAVKVQVNVPTVSNAEVILPDGSQKELPFDLEGQDGQTVEFTIRAEGYKDRKVRLDINPRRRYYDYMLEKQNP